MSITVLVNKQSNDNATRVEHTFDNSEIFICDRFSNYGHRRDLGDIYDAISDAVEKGNELVLRFENNDEWDSVGDESKEELESDYEHHVDFIAGRIKGEDPTLYSVEILDWSYPQWICDAPIAEEDE